MLSDKKENWGIPEELLKILDVRLTFLAQKRCGKNLGLENRKKHYLDCLREWINGGRLEVPQTTVVPLPAAPEVKIAFANYLATSALRHEHHFLMQEKKEMKKANPNPNRMFSSSTTSMAIAQGLLARGLSKDQKENIWFTEAWLYRIKALRGYKEAITEPKLERKPC